MHVPMRARFLLSNGFACAWLVAAVLATLAPAARADDAALIVGIVTNTDRQPVAHATVTVSNGTSCPHHRERS